METGAAGLIAQIDYLADDRECLKAETVSHTFCSSTSLLPNIDPYVQELKNVACKLLQEQLRCISEMSCFQNSKK